jgi:hypothetical protein
LEVAAARGVRPAYGSVGGLCVLGGTGGVVAVAGTRLLFLDNLIKEPRILCRILVIRTLSGIFPGAATRRALRATRRRP